MGDYTEFQTEDRNKIEWRSEFVGVMNYRKGHNNVMFYLKTVPDAKLSAEAGRPQRISKIFIKIKEPGDRLTEVDRPALDGDKQLYAREWALYQQNKEQIPDGCPIDLLFAADPAIAENLKAYGFHTVEQVANANANSIQSIMGMQTWVNRAQSYLAQSSKGVEFHRYQRDLEDRDRQIKTLTQQFEMAKQEIANLRNAFQNVGIAQAQAVNANMAQTRPVYPQAMMPSTQMYAQAAPGVQPTQSQTNVIPMPTAPLAPVFDAQTSQINAVQAQTARRGRPPGSKNRPKEVEPLPVTKLEPPSI